MSDEPKSINVISLNQQGGVTAHTVNVGNASRSLDRRQAGQLDQLLQGIVFSSITVSSQMGDSEAYQFAEQVKAHLEASGHDVEGVHQSMWSRPFAGQRVRGPNKDGTLMIDIGRHP